MWVAATLAGLAILAVLVLCVPLVMVFQVEVYDGIRFQMRLAWLFGLVGKDIRTGKKPGEEEKLAAKRKRPRKRLDIKTMFRILRIKGLLKKVKRLLRDVLGCFSIRDIKADFTVGLDDPADTGMFFAIVGPATHFLADIRLQPAFADEMVFQGYLHGRIRLQPIHLIPPVTRFVFSLPVMRVAKTLVVARWKRKR
ncbi:hypothetical protein ACFLTL_02460 [Chloroflexota bacterium]